LQGIARVEGAILGLSPSRAPATVRDAVFYCPIQSRTISTSLAPGDDSKGLDFQG
jgi:hypothetical protein